MNQRDSSQAQNPFASLARLNRASAQSLKLAASFRNSRVASAALEPTGGFTIPAPSGITGLAGMSASRLGGHGLGATVRSGLSARGCPQLASSKQLRLSRIVRMVGGLVQKGVDGLGGDAGFDDPAFTGFAGIAGVLHRVVVV